MNRVLIIDDDDQLRSSFQRLLTEEGYQVDVAPSGEAGLEAVKKDSPDLVILDIRLPGMNGLDTFQAINGVDSRLPVIIMTAYGTTETAIEATKRGAYDYILKPFDIPDMLSRIRQALKAGCFMRSPVAINAQPNTFDRDAIIGSGPAIQEIFKGIGRVAATDATVLIRGESGTGKELTARAIYHHSHRANKSFLVINCVAIPDTLLESELFGYERGAFTGASHRRIGKIEQASGGTIFLDEIGDMPFNLQAKLLRLLQEKSIERLGGRETIPVDVRIIAATNRNLEEMIAEHRFREDLYYRLKVVTLMMPPLRERTEDIEALSHYLLSRFSSEMGIEHSGISPEALATLRSLPWPGNIRELSNTLQKALIFSPGRAITRNDILSAAGDREHDQPPESAVTEDHLREWIRDQVRWSTATKNLYESATETFSSLLIEEALNFTDGNRSQAAKLLGISRPTLHAKIEKYHLKLTTSVKKPSV